MKKLAFNDPSSLSEVDFETLFQIRLRDEKNPDLQKAL